MLTDSALARVIAGHGLDDSPDRYPSRPLGSAAWRTFRAVAHTERLEPLLAAAVADDSLPVTDEQRADVEHDQEELMKAAVELDRLLIATIQTLEDAEIETRVLKGASTAQIAYASPSMRGYGDVDVLVPADALGRAVALLEAEGGSRRYPEPRPGYDDEFSKGACVVTESDLEIDVHRSIAAGPFGQMIDLGELFAGTHDFVLGGRSLRALSADRRLVHAAYHAMLGATPPRLVALRDVVQLALASEATLEAALDLARSWRGEAVMALGLREAWRTLAPQERPDAIVWAERYEPSRADVRRLRAYMGETRSTARQSLEAVLVIPGLGARLRYARAIALPSENRRGRTARWRGAVAR